MLQVLNATRAAVLRVFYALHHRYRPGDYETWKYIAPRTGLGTELSHSRRHKMNLKLLRFLVVSLAAAMSLTPPAAVLAQQLTAPKAKNVVLVHGLFADGSSWSEVIPRLQAAGLNVTSVQNPLTTLPEAVDAPLRARTTEWTDGSGRTFIFRDDRHRGRCASECLGAGLCGCARAGCRRRLRGLGQAVSHAASFSRHSIRWR